MYEIRPLQKEDVIFVYNVMSEPDNLSALHTESVSLKEWQSIFSEAEKDADEENFIVYKNDVPCCWLKLNGLQNYDIAYISTIAVSDKFKRQGVGEYAVEFAVEYLTRRGFIKVNLHTTKDNLPAIKLYEKCGFNLTKRKRGKITFSRVLNDLSFTNVTKENVSHYKNFRKIFVKYKIKTLRNHGESPCGKKTFYNLFDTIVSKTTDNGSDFFIVMQSDRDIVGFAMISVASIDIIDIPYSYGTVNDFYIFPKHRRKGYGSILNRHIESIFSENGTNTVLLKPDPVSGIDFWKAMGYRDTGIHQGWGKHFVYIKHLTESEICARIDNSISKLVTPTDWIGINPYNKPQIKEVYGVWKEYCREENQKSHRKDVAEMAWNSRKNRSISFKALYYQGKIIGFRYKADDEINYALSEYRKEGKYYEQTEHI